MARVEPREETACPRLLAPEAMNALCLGVCVCVCVCVEACVCAYVCLFVCLFGWLVGWLFSVFCGVCVLGGREGGSCVRVVLVYSSMNI
jgi:hypothetical protein